MWGLALSSLRHRSSAFAATFAAMFIGAAIVTACGGLFATGVTLAVPPHRLAGAAVVVTGDQTYSLPKADPRDEEEDVQWGTFAERVPLDARLVKAVAAVPGVLSVEPVHDASGGRLDAIGVGAKDAKNAKDAEELAQRITATVLRGHAAVALTGDDRGLAEFPEALPSRENLIILSAVFGALGIMIAMFVVGGTLSLSVQQRLREMALLRAIGSTPGQVRRMVTGEALIVAAGATLLGCLAGPLLGRWLFDRLVSAGVVPPVVEFRQGLLPALVAAAISLLTTLVAALAAARRAANAKPAEALAEAALPAWRLGRGRLAIVLLCVLGGVALAFVTILVMAKALAGSTAGPAVLVWAIGLALLAPPLSRALIGLLSGPIRAASGPAGYLAVLNARARAVRMAAAITPVMLATGMATANLYMQTTQSDAATAAYVAGLRADAVLSADGRGIPPGLLDEVRATPGVTAASEYALSTGFVESPHDNWQREDGWPLRGVTADAAAKTTALSVTEGSLAGLKGDTVALSAEHARNIGGGVGIGDELTMRLGDGQAVRLRVAALLDTPIGDELFVMPARILAPHTTSGLPAQILVATAPGTDPGTLALPGVRVLDREQAAAGFGEQQQTQAWVNYLMVGLIMIYTAIALVNTQVMVTAARRREFGLQRLTGSTRAQVLRMTGIEGLMVAVIGVVLGTVASVVTLVPFSITVAGSPLPSGPIVIYLGIVGVAVALTLAATWVPTWLVTRSRPAEAATAAY
ncbi:ABC transporter permease [Spongiactinospora sp. TRM90649]|uniref:ABC transporter permease n=1 Tax=Spongiactinospora sp. TRM90649 TaxID=3031114 RepID=UPI0023F94D0D|nr:ABC transporter permease [Spongiactinospora sp. TRM90649]MDF5755645.1 FtsX-like permease family protein [Spongiactinospora sp. TRM90649]